LATDHGSSQERPGATGTSTDARTPEAPRWLLAAVLEQVGDGVVVSDVSGRFLLFNSAARRVVGRGPTELPPERWPEHFRVFRPDGVTPFPNDELPLVRAMRGEVVDDVEMVVSGPDDAEPSRISVRGRPVRDEGGELLGGVITFRDITEARRTEALLRQSEARYRALTELVSDHAFEFVVNPDRSLTPVWISETLRTVAGFSAVGDVTRDRLRAFIHPADRETFRAHRNRLEQGEVDEAEFRIIGIDGSVRWVRNKVRPVRDPETGRLVRILGAARDITDQKLLDPLTNLPNRAAFLDRVSVAVARLARAPEESVAVLFVDLDRFQVFNQSLGYAVGDELLRVCADRLSGVVAPGDTVAHLHGDEFGVLLTELEHPSDALQIAQEIAQALSSPVDVGGTRVAPSASVGIAFATDPEHDAPDVLRSAQTAVSRAKRAGKGRYEVYDPAMQEAAHLRLRLEAALREAIDGSRFPVLYQPIVRLRDRRVVGFEALVRWDDPVQGVLPPEAFVPLAEETGLIVEIGDHVLRRACRQLREWQDRLPAARDVVMSVNVSARQVGMGDLLDRLDAALESSGLEGRSLKLEITESLLVEDPEAAEALLQAVRSRGVRLGLDDFGTGHSALAYLRRFPVDTLKVDRSFVQGLHAGSDDEGIVDTIVALADHLRLDVVAEGLETEEQLDLIRRLGCTHGQGYLFAPPLEAEEALAHLARSRGVDLE
jgi:diguanylate cyclase (GGDEF)-like protein/PAS domain S-box-containing protein